MIDLNKAIRTKYAPELIDKVKQIYLGPKSDIDKFFVLMKNRLLVGIFRYENLYEYWDKEQMEIIGKDWEYGYKFCNYTYEYISTKLYKKRLQYAIKGNTELLIDIANYHVFIYKLYGGLNSIFICYIIHEFFYPKHPRAHFKCEDQGIEGDNTTN